MEESKKNTHTSPPNKLRKIASDDIKQQIYSSKLAEALRRVCRQSSPHTSSTVTGRKVRETANHILAVAEKGKTRWSRAILSSRFQQRLAKRRRTKKMIGRKTLRLPETNKGKRKLPEVERKVKILGRLVPGCRKLSFPNLMEEAKDYISALEMQVRAMAALADLLAGAQSNRLGNPNDSLN